MGTTSKKNGGGSTVALAKTLEIEIAEDRLKIEKIQADLDARQTDLAEKMTVLSFLRKTLGSAKVAVATRRGRPPKGEKSVIGQAIEILREKGAPMHVQYEIVPELRKQGLDMGLSSLYSALKRHRNVEFVSASTFTFCDSPDKKTVESSNGEEWEAFISSLTPRQIDVLRCVKKAPAGVTSGQIAVELGVVRTTVTGSIGGGLRKTIPKAGYAFEDIFDVDMTDKERVYSPGEILLTHNLPPGGG